MPNLADYAIVKDSDSSGYNTESVMELQEEVQESFDKILESVNCEQVLDLESDMIEDQDKDTVISWLVDALESLRQSRNLLRDAAAEIDVLQKDAIKDKASIIQLQREVIEENKKGIKAMQTNIQTEIKSYRDAVCSQNDSKCDAEQITVEDVKEAVKSVTEENARSRNIMVFGLDENKDLKKSLSGLFEQLGEEPCIEHCERIGRPVTNSTPRPRPVKVTLSTTNSVETTLKRSHLLRGDTGYNSVFISPDRSEEERRAHKELVNTLKLKNKEEPQYYHSIRKDQIISSPKKKEERSPPPLR